jgi:hypothetical protein
MAYDFAAKDLHGDFGLNFQKGYTVNPPYFLEDRRLKGRSISWLSTEARRLDAEGGTRTGTAFWARGF